MSTPTECSTEGFSKTACGFVIEFVDIISKRMLSYNMLSVSEGWPASALYTYVNDDIYNALPSELKAGIIDTYTVSGYGADGSSNNITTDKLYLLSSAEIWENGTSQDTAVNVTRQLDYYKSIGVTTNNYSGAIKKYNGSDTIWWLRSARSNSSNSFITVESDGNIGSYPPGYQDTYYYNGVSPAFRIG